MLRRRFLKAASLAAASSVLAAGPLSAAVNATAVAPRLQLLRAAADCAGAPFRAVGTIHGDGPSRLLVHIDALHPAERGAVLDRLALRAVFASADGAESAFMAWHHGTADGASRSDRVRFAATAGGLLRFEVDYRVAAEPAACNESCQLAAISPRTLLPGQYVLLGPGRDGRAVDASALTSSGNPESPIVLAGRDFDYLAIRVEAVA